MPPELTLGEIAATPDRATETFRLPDGRRVVLRPYQLGDEGALEAFFDGLGEDTRAAYGVTDTGEGIAQDWSQSIGIREDLRLVFEEALGRGAGERVGLHCGVAEFSLELGDEERERLGRWNEFVDPGAAVRFGICLSDDHQGVGLATAAMPSLTRLVRRLGRRRILLWGGVLVRNGAAVAFYERSGFRTLGTWVDERGRTRLDMVLDI